MKHKNQKPKEPENEPSEQPQAQMPAGQMFAIFVSEAERQVLLAVMDGGLKFHGAALNVAAVATLFARVNNAQPVRVKSQSAAKQLK